ncbi:bifunctional diaminohydroxyphosphoribosylaminopyrimidine deaminase/5-amino-6-(5-phosphoribosylamino)uracil reductase RibD [Streptococcus caviae]|uniref:bifunctional diaminohydroxyphosphoribosylaminopyrimidine deaminase/5-amino-6-(5-phosphoribosylamino)uracil reductase RibD n=1 Tax=Streptococcus sp. 'caviae' TaxID=1915004 RepID=UPI00094B986D|nr:bifunctional diaminohydroxyphosphoribosylaminopyrimidine deaminase/5-amino-6-(5-phosphoribosylamino)uracil reductase RibD [Streptococcus sp. 'caviae']OLN84145.1 riboflavin biosynthesis protein RibD [Streptococcus sp. 'caviae']
MDEQFMALAIAKAKEGKGQTYTNPLVGAVIVKNNQVIAEGAHLKYGDGHAERNAIMACQNAEQLRGAVLYVTLEPCHHQGKQPPCTDIIVQAGIARVVIAQLDPNPLVAGKGRQFLEQQGITVDVGLLKKEAEALNPYYNHFYQRGRPYIVLKSAMSLDGKIAFKSRRTALTGKKAIETVHRERDDYQAILVGSQTALLDDPKLLGTKSSLFPPIRVVLDRRGRLFKQRQLQLFTNDEAPVYLFSQRSAENLPDHVTVFCDSNWTVAKVVKKLAEEGIQSLYVEGGSRIHDAFYEANLWDEWLLYLAPVLLGGDALASMSSSRMSQRLTHLSVLSLEQVGEDWRLSAKRKEDPCLQD